MFIGRVTRHLIFDGRSVRLRAEESGREVRRDVSFSMPRDYFADGRALGLALRDMFREVEARRFSWTFPTVIVRRVGDPLNQSEREKLSALLTELGVSKVEFA